MAAIAEATSDPYARFRDELIDAGLLIPVGVRGLYGRSGELESVIEGFDAYVTKRAADRPAEVIHLPPVLSRRTYLKTDHSETFPQLMGSVHTFMGDERKHLQLSAKRASGEDWTTELTPSEVMLAPATCYAVYPMATGTLPPGGRTIDLRSFVFRHEPSDDPARMQSFRMREFVRIGTPDEALEHRDHWLRLAEEILLDVGLDVKPVVANDPFFGRGGRVMAATQREQELKYELVATVASDEKPTAVASANYHLDHFGLPFEIRTSDGLVAHSACLGFGRERVALALVRKHGFRPAQWPAEVRRILSL